MDKVDYASILDLFESPFKEKAHGLTEHLQPWSRTGRKVWTKRYSVV